MRILHTSDWHLGKKIELKSRLEEQRAALKHLVSVVKDERVDLVLISGDVFDTAVPPADAEELFYDAVTELAGHSKVVIISGNHDDPLRLCASMPLAVRQGIFLVGGLDNSHIKTDCACGGEGYIKFRLNGETLNLGLLPFPSPSRIQLPEIEGDFTAKIKALIDVCCSCFDQEGVNVFASHLFVEGGEFAGGEKELGTAILVNKCALPQARYIALGHIHRPQVVSRSLNAYYCGSLLPYTFDDTTQKGFVIFDSKTSEIKVVPVEGGRKMVRADVYSFDEAMDFLAEHEADLVHINYVSDIPLKNTQSAELKAHECLVKLTVQTSRVKTAAGGRAEKSLAELFEAFYESRRGQNVKPPKRLTELFLEVMEGEE